MERGVPHGNRACRKVRRQHVQLTIGMVQQLGRKELANQLWTSVQRLEPVTCPGDFNKFIHFLNTNGGASR